MIKKITPLPPPTPRTVVPRKVTPVRPIFEAPLDQQELKVKTSPWTRLLIILFLAIGVAGAWSFWHFRQAEKKLSKPQDAVAKQLQVIKQEEAALVAKIARLMVLPEGEEPVIATISDIASLAKNQPFYADAHNGDRVIVYMKAKKAIIYDPNADKIVNVGPIFLEPPSGQTTTTASGTAMK